MKSTTPALVCLIFVAAVPACVATDSLAHIHQKENLHAAVHVNATAKSKKTGIKTVVGMLEKIKKKTTEEMDKAANAYNAIEKQCLLERQSITLQIEEGKDKKESLDALVEELLAKYGDLGARIAELAQQLAREMGELAKAKEDRARENALFEKEEAELLSTIGMLRGAMSIITNNWEAIERGDFSLLQLNNTTSVKAFEQALNSLLQASMLNSADAAKLTALIQGSTQSSDSSLDTDDEGGAPSAEVYTSKQKTSSGEELKKLFDDLLGQFQSTLERKQADEKEAAHQYTVLRIRLGDKIELDDSEKEEDETEKDETKEDEAEAEGEQKTEEERLKELDELLAKVFKICMKKAEEHAIQRKNREMELDAVKAAIDALKEGTAPSSFLQIASRAKDGENTDAVQFLRNFAQKRNSVVLTQMAAKIESVMGMGSQAGDDPFVKVKGMIATLIAKLQEELKDATTKKDYCDSQIESLEKQKEKSRKLISERTLDRDKFTSKATELRQQISDLTVELQVIDETRAREKELRDTANALYLETRADDQRAIDGIKIALKVLKEYYNEKADDKSMKRTASTILGILEMLDGEITKNMSEDKADEEQKQKEYKELDDEYIKDKARKESQVKIYNRQVTDFESKAARAQNDIDEEQPNHDGFKGELEKLHDECTTKVKTLAERVADRDAEIQGLTETLEILNTQTVLVQTSVKHTKLRPVKRSLRGFEA